MALLRGSAEYTGDTYDIRSIHGEGVQACGIPHAEVLVEFAEAALSGEVERLLRARFDIEQTLGGEALVDSAAVVAIFEAVVRIADATGIQIEVYKAELTADVRSELGLDQFVSAAGKDPLAPSPRDVSSPNR